MSRQSSVLPLFARVLLRVGLSARARERAQADLLALFARIDAQDGVQAARRACVREVVSILIWQLVDGLRRIVEWRPSRLDLRRRTMLRDLGQELRLSARALARRPGFTLVAVGVLALGLGSSVAIFSLADGLFLRPPSGVRAPGELVRVFRSWAPGQGGSLAYADYLDYRAGGSTLSGLAAFGSSTLAASARVAGAPSPARVLTITPDYFDVLGVEPAAGRFFLEEENQTVDAHPVAVVSWSFWVAHLGGATTAVGRDLLLNGHRFTVVGVTPRQFRGIASSDNRVDVYIPILMRNAVEPQTGRAWYQRIPGDHERWLAVVGRMRAGASAQAVQGQLAGIAGRIQALQPSSERKETVLVTQKLRWYPTQRTSLTGLTRVLLAAVAMLLAIAAANVAILLLARASARDREIGVRAALGAGRTRIARQMMSESVLLGAAGCLLGVAISGIGTRVAGALLPVQLETQLVPNARALVFAVALAFCTALLVGVAPALRAARSDVVGLIHGRDRRAGGGRVRDILIVVQIALSLVLVAGSVLFARSFAAVRSVDVGFDDRNVLLVGVNLRNHGYNAERGRAFVRTALDRIGALPGVTLATVTRMVPFQGDWSTTMKPWAGANFQGGSTELTVGLNVVGPRYFEGMRIPILRGREITPADAEQAAPVVVVNETFAQRAFGTTDVIGRTVPLRSNLPPLTIVGVARAATYYELGEDPVLQAYGSVMQVYQPDLTFLIKTAADPVLVSADVQSALHALNPDLAFAAVETLADVHAQQMARFRATAQVVGFTGLIALLLASAGLYGVMAYRVAQRTREIGLRMALGATRGGLAGDVVLRGLRLVMVGSTIGLAATLMLSRLAASLLYNVPARDPVSLIAAPVVLIVVAACAVVVPARRAMRVDPLVAMRTD